MVIEAHSGAWSPAARGILNQIAKNLAAIWNEYCEIVSLRMAQRLSITLHRANARAVLRRTTPPEAGSTVLPWEEALRDEHVEL